MSDYESFVIKGPLNELIHFSALSVARRKTGRTTFGLPRKFRVSGRCTREGR